MERPPENGRTDAERAAHYWETRLKGERRIERAQDPRCEIGVVVPVSRERIDRLERQLASFLRQQGVDRNQFEVIYTVNNGLPDGTEKFRRTAEANQRAIEWIRGLGLPNVHVIDKSSRGNEIPKCNVGRARNRGLAEASLRFHENRRNGLIIQTDADSYVEDPRQLARLKDRFDRNPDVIGAAGGLVFEWNPDEEDPEKRALLRRKLDRFVLKTKWNMYAHYLRNPDDPYIDANDHFSGAHMISRSFESAAIGGLADLDAGEDPRFGADLRDYAATHGQRVVNLRDEFFVVTALRDSDRTGASFKQDFDSIDLDRPDLLPDPLRYVRLPEFRKQMEVALRDGFRDPATWRRIMTGPTGLVVSEQELGVLTSHAATLDAIDPADPFLQEWKRRNFGEIGNDVARYLFDQLNPPVAMTPESLARIETEVAKTEIGRRLIDRLGQYSRQIRMIDD